EEKKIPQRATRQVTARRLSMNLFGDAIKAYEEENYEPAIELLSRFLSEGLETAAAYYYLSDAYFLSAEAMTEHDAKKERYYRRQQEVAERGHLLFPHHEKVH